MAAACIRLVFVVVVLVSAANAKSVKISDAQTSRNYSAIESVNDVVNDLINQTSFIINASNASSTTTTSERANLTSTTDKVTVGNDQAVKQRKGILLGLWGRESTAATEKEPSLDSQDDDEDDDDDEDVSEEESDTSLEPDLITDLRNDSATTRAPPQDVPNFHFSFKISHDDAYNAETLDLRVHLNRTIEKLREFNDKYEKLIEENKTIRKDLRELKYNSSRPWTTRTTRQPNDDSVSLNEDTTTSRVESTSAAKTTKAETDQRRNAVRTHLLV